MQEFYYVVKDVHIFGMGYAECDNIIVFRTGNVLVDRINALRYIEKLIADDSYNFYEFKLVEVLGEDWFREYTLIQTFEGWNTVDSWIETRIQYLAFEADMLKDIGHITDDDIVSVSGLSMICGTETLLPDYFSNLSLEEELAVMVETGNLSGLTEHFQKLGTRYLNHVLLVACKKGKLKIAKECIELGADINFLDSLPLYHAIYSGNVELVDFLIKHGADWQRNIDDIIQTGIGVGLPWSMELGGERQHDWDPNSKISLWINAVIRPHKN